METVNFQIIFSYHLNHSVVLNNYGKFKTENIIVSFSDNNQNDFYLWFSLENT
jgi:hypothetical protein